MIFWMLFMTGVIIIPVHYEQKIDANSEKMLTIATLFWSYRASSRPDGYRHRVLHNRILLIGRLGSQWKRLLSIVWTVITELQEQKPPQA